MPSGDFGRDEFARFCKGINELWHIDLASYGQRQLHRRLRAMMLRAGAADLGEFLRCLRSDAVLSESFRDQFTINVSEFFRDAHLFERLQEMLRPGGTCHAARRLWSAGCSYGAEPYSLAILMDESNPAADWRITATDIDRQALDKAREGIFTDRDLRNVSPVRRRRYFTPAPPAGFAISERLKQRISFSDLDLLDPHCRCPRDCDIILCRNVIIYFTTEAKQRVHEMLAKSLRPGGVLLVGATERVAEAAQLGLTCISPFFYQKPACH